MAEEDATTPYSPSQNNQLYMTQCVCCVFPFYAVNPYIKWVEVE